MRLFSKVVPPLVMLMTMSGMIGQTTIDIWKQARAISGPSGFVLGYVPGSGMAWPFVVDPNTLEVVTVNGARTIRVKPQPPAQINCIAGPSGLISVTGPCIIDATALVPTRGGGNDWTGWNTYTGVTNHSGASQTAPFRIGDSLPPATCNDVVREWYYSKANNTLYVCNGPNLWAAYSPGGGGGFPSYKGTPLQIGGNMTLTSNPLPGWPIQIFRNGILQNSFDTSDYTLGENTVTPNPNNPWHVEDVIAAYWWSN